MKKYKQYVAEVAERRAFEKITNAAIGKQIEGLVEVQRDYIMQFKENKELNKVIETQNSTIRSQDEVISAHQRSINALKGILELDKKARNPNRVIGRKRGRPQGSKSKAVAFGAEAMPDNDLVTFGSTEEFEATLM